MKRGALIVFLKAPQAGRVKTRLAREVGAGRAAALFRQMTLLTLRQAARGTWRTILAVDRDADLFAWRAIWPRRFGRIAQGPGSLGDRMRRAMRAAPAGPVVIIGADAPALRAGHIEAAFKALGSADAVVGPAADGGYWLIGLARRRRAPALFENVRWSGPDALADTLATLPPSFLTAYLPVLRDIDEAEDLAAAPPLLLSAR